MIVQICLLIVWKNFNQKASQIHYLKRREVGCCVNSFRGVKPQFIHFISNCCFAISFEKIFLIFILNRKLISSLEERFHSSGISFKQKVCFTVWKSCIVDCFGISSIYFKQKVCSIIVLVLQTVSKLVSVIFLSSFIFPPKDSSSKTLPFHTSQIQKVQMEVE